MSDKIKSPDTIHDIVLDTSKKYPEKAALMSAMEPDNSYTYGSFEKILNSLAETLVGTGISKGDRVGILSYNCPEWPLFYLSILNARGVAVPLDNNLKETEIGNLLRLSGIKIIACSKDWLKPVENLITLNGLNIKAIDLIETVQSAATDDKAKKPDIDQADKDDPAVIIYTSGTTGDPKGVVLTHQNIVSNVIAARNALKLVPEDRFLSILPLHHTFEATCGFLIQLMTGMSVVYARSLKSRDIKEDIADYKITVMIAVPLLYEKMYSSIIRKISDAPVLKKAMIGAFMGISRITWKMSIKAGKKMFASLRSKAGLDSIRMFVSGGAPLPARVAEWFNLAGFIFLEGYGMTECSPVISVNRPDDTRFGTVGPPLPGIKVKIDNPGPDGVGQIVVKGPNNTPGYLDNPAATEELYKDGWLQTGDLGIIEKGHIRITGRAKNLIVSGAGKNIYPEEIEAELALSPYIAEALVLGRTRPGKTGEEVWALLYPDIEQIELLLDISCLTPEKLRNLMKKEVNAVNQKIADYKRIGNFEIRAEEFEKTSTRKIKRMLYK